MVTKAGRAAMSTGIGWNKRLNKPEWPAYSRLIWLVTVLYDHLAPSCEGWSSAPNKEIPLHYFSALLS